MIYKSAKQVVNAALGRTPLVPEEEQAYRRLLAKGFRPKGIIDVGAYEGNWTRLARRVFPSTPVLMVEAQESKVPSLKATCAELTDVSFVNALLGSRSNQKVTFYEMETGSSMLAENSNIARTEVRLLTRTLDEVAGGVPEPLFLKLDVQGAEMSVLEGGTQTLNRAEVVQLEVAMLAYNKGAPSFLEMVSYMDDRGFVPFDYSGFTRPNGQDLVQVDILFARQDSTLRPTFFEY